MDGVDALQRTQRVLEEHGVAALCVGAGADLRYLTGYEALALERLTLLVARADGAHVLIVPDLERSRAEDQGVAARVAIRSFGETDDPFALAAGALDGVPPDAALGVGDTLWATFLLGLQAVRPTARWVRASTVTRELRMRKAPDEVDRLRAAGAAIDRVHARVPDVIAPGRTEAEVGRDIAALIVEEGHERADFVIVGSGPNGASPHHETSGRRLERGDAVVVDIGGPLDGWFSDCTRNFAVGGAPDGYADVFEALRRAQDAAVRAVRPGVRAEEVDAAARTVLADAGYAEQFVHRTGHGIGLEVHEEPYIVDGNDLVLEAGMTFSIEPGVYLRGRFGMRIEDIVAVTADGVERLNRVERDLVVVA